MLAMAECVMAEPTFGAAVQAEREALGWDQKALAGKIGVAPSTVNRWESGKLVPKTPPAVYRLAAVLHQPPQRWLALAGLAPRETEPATSTPLADVKAALGRTDIKPAVRGAIGLLVQELADQHAAEGVRRFDAVVADELPADGLRIVGAAGASPEHIAQARDMLLRIRTRLFALPTPPPE